MMNRILRAVVFSAGWVVLIASAATATPKRLSPPASMGAAERSLAPQDSTPLGELAKVILATGMPVDLVGMTATRLGLTENDQFFPVTQVGAVSPTEERYINVGTLNGKIVIVAFWIAKRGDKQVDFVYYRSSESGELDRAIYARNNKVTQLTREEAEAGWQKHKSFWIQRLVKPTAPAPPPPLGP